MSFHDRRPSQPETGAPPWSRPELAALGALLALYLYRTVRVVWPYLFRDGGDFEGYFRAAGEMLAGRSPFLDRFDYPPLVAFLALPLHPLGLDGARVAWFVLSQGSLLGSAWALYLALGRDRAAAWTVAALWAGAGTLQENLALGQVHPLLLLLFALAWLRESHGPGAAPAGAALALGLAAGLKIWPGLLLAGFLGRERRRALAVGLGMAALAVALPLGLIAALLPPPHLPTRSDYWMGTPAFLNTSLPALALRATEPGLRMDAPPPSDWIAGNSSETYRLPPERRRLSVAVSLGTLVLGLAAIALRRPGRLPLLAALTALATLASPLSWYHYQIFQLPALALLAAPAIREGRPWRLAGFALLAFALTRIEARAFLLGEGTTGEILGTGAAIAALHLTVFVLLLARRRDPRAD